MVGGALDAKCFTIRNIQIDACDGGGIVVDSIELRHVEADFGSKSTEDRVSRRLLLTPPLALCLVHLLIHRFELALLGRRFDRTGRPFGVEVGLDGGEVADDEIDTVPPVLRPQLLDERERRPACFAFEIEEFDEGDVTARHCIEAVTVFADQLAGIFCLCLRHRGRLPVANRKIDTDPPMITVMTVKTVSRIRVIGAMREFVFHMCSREARPGRRLWSRDAGLGGIVLASIYVLRP